MISIDEFLEHFEGVKKQGKGWTALCPAHDDRTPSLSIDVGDNGGIVFHCFAGCAQERILEIVGRTWADVGWRGASPRPRVRPPGACSQGPLKVRAPSVYCSALFVANPRKGPP